VELFGEETEKLDKLDDKVAAVCITLGNCDIRDAFGFLSSALEGTSGVARR
jgi:hypothetical protein